MAGILVAAAVTSVRADGEAKRHDELSDGVRKVDARRGDARASAKENASDICRWDLLLKENAWKGAGVYVRLRSRDMRGRPGCASSAGRPQWP